LLKHFGKIIGRRYYKGFNNFLEVDNMDMEPGVYEIEISPLWNESAESDIQHKMLRMDILCPEKVKIDVIIDHHEV